MNEPRIRILALVSSLLGLALLFIISSSALPGKTDIRSITIEDVGRSLKVCGTITSKRIYNSHVFFTVSDETGSIKAVTFNTTALRMRDSGNNIYALSSNDVICITGTIGEYPRGSGVLEIINKKGMLEKIR